MTNITKMEKIFSWIWRINGLLILIVALFVVTNIGSDMLEKNSRKPREPEPIVTTIVADPDGKEQWVLGTPVEIDGSDFAFIRLESENESVDISDGTLGMLGANERYEAKKAKNVLFLSTKYETANWLFNDINQLIISIRALPEREYTSYFSQPKKLSTARVILYSVISMDTNQDGLVNELDSSSLAISDIDGTNYNVVIEKTDRIMDANLLDENTLSVLYQLDGGVYSQRFSLEPFRSLGKFEIPEVGG